MRGSWPSFSGLQKILLGSNVNSWRGSWWNLPSSRKSGISRFDEFIISQLNNYILSWYKKYEAKSFSEFAHNPRRGAWIVNPILASILKALLVTLVSTVAAIALEKIRRHNQDRYDDYDQSHYDDYGRW